MMVIPCCNVLMLAGVAEANRDTAREECDFRLCRPKEHAGVRYSAWARAHVLVASGCGCYCGEGVACCIFCAAAHQLVLHVRKARHRRCSLPAGESPPRRCSPLFEYTDDHLRCCATAHSLAYLVSHGLSAAAVPQSATHPPGRAKAPFFSAPCSRLAFRREPRQATAFNSKVPP